MGGYRRECFLVRRSLYRRGECNGLMGETRARLLLGKKVAVNE